MNGAEAYEKAVDIVRKSIGIGIEALFPSRCEGCGTWGTFLCRHCAYTLTPADPPPHSETYALWSYRDTLVHTILWKLKYRSQKAFADVIAQALTDIITEVCADIALMESARKPLLIPIPLSPGRQKERGYNQSARIVKSLLRYMNGDIENGDGILIKTRETQSQMATKNRKTRLENLHGAFSVPDRACVAGRVIIVIDDVTTTGATFAEARRALKDAGAQKIICCAAAH